MSQGFRKFAVLVFVLRWPLLLAFILATLFFGYEATSLRIDPSTETLFTKTTPEYRFYQEFKENFGSDHLVAVAIETSDYLTLTNLRLTHVLTRLLASDRRVDRVVSVTNALDIRHKIFGVKIEPLISGVFEGEKSIQEFREEALRHPLIQGNLVSRDGKVGAILLRLRAKPKDPNFLQGYIGELRRTLKSFSWRGVRFYVAGSPVEQYDLTDSIQRDQAFFIPAVALFLILATFLIYRNGASVVVAMSVVFVTLVWTFGTVSLMGRPLNLVNSLLGPVVMIVTVTSVVHLINLFCELRPHHPSLRECICLTLQHLGIPCFLAAATTVAGFLSLCLNRVPAVQSFGVAAAIGTSYSYLITMVLTPLLLPILPLKGDWRAEGEQHFFNRIIVYALERIEFHLKWILLAIAALLLILAVVGLPRIRIDTNLVRDLRPDSALAVATRFIDQRLAGVYSLGISIERKDRGPMVTVETMKKVDAFAQFMEAMPEITKVNSLPLLVKKVHEAREGEAAAFAIPEDEETLQTYLEKMAESNNPDFWSFISRDFRRLSLEGRMKAIGTEKGRVREEKIWSYVRENFGDEYRIRLTGSVVLLGQMAERLVTNQLQSLGFTFFLILALIAFFFRSFMMGLLAAVPNLFPILGLYGLMGWAGIELSTTTAMISSVALGLVVDASVHFLYRFRFEFDHRHHYLQALHHTYRNVGQALVVATLILVFGFASSVFASFRPTIYFGLLTSLTIFFALVCTLVLLPLILILLKPFGKAPLFGALSKLSKETLTPQTASSIISRLS